MALVGMEADVIMVVVGGAVVATNEVVVLSDVVMTV